MTSQPCLPLQLQDLSALLYRPLSHLLQLLLLTLPLKAVPSMYHLLHLLTLPSAKCSKVLHCSRALPAQFGGQQGAALFQGPACPDQSDGQQGAALSQGPACTDQFGGQQGVALFQGSACTDQSDGQHSAALLQGPAGTHQFEGQQHAALPQGSACTDQSKGQYGVALPHCPIASAPSFPGATNAHQGTFAARLNSPDTDTGFDQGDQAGAAAFLPELTLADFETDLQGPCPAADNSMQFWQSLVCNDLDIDSMPFEERHSSTASPAVSPVAQLSSSSLADIGISPLLPSSSGSAPEVFPDPESSAIYSPCSVRMSDTSECAYAPPAVENSSGGMGDVDASHEDVTTPSMREDDEDHALVHWHVPTCDGEYSVALSLGLDIGHECCAYALVCTAVSAVSACFPVLVDCI